MDGDRTAARAASGCPVGRMLCGWRGVCADDRHGVALRGTPCLGGSYSTMRVTANVSLVLLVNGHSN